MTFVCQVRERVSSNRDEQRQKDIWEKDAKKSKSNPVPMKTDQRRPWLDGRRNFRLLSWTGRTSEWLDYKFEVTSLEWRMTTNFVELWDVMYRAIFDSCKLWKSNKYHQTLSAKGNQCVCVCVLNINWSGSHQCVMKHRSSNPGWWGRMRITLLSVHLWCFKNQRGTVQLARPRSLDWSLHVQDPFYQRCDPD